MHSRIYVSVLKLEPRHNFVSLFYFHIVFDRDGDGKTLVRFLFCLLCCKDLSSLPVLMTTKEVKIHLLNRNTAIKSLQRFKFYIFIISIYITLTIFAAFYTLYIHISPCPWGAFSLRPLSHSFYSYFIKKIYYCY